MKFLKFCKRYAKKIIAGLWITGFIICLLLSQLRTSAAVPNSTGQTVTASLNLNGFSIVSVGQTAYDDVLKNTYLTMWKPMSGTYNPVSVSFYDFMTSPQSGVSMGSGSSSQLFSIHTLSGYQVELRIRDGANSANVIAFYPTSSQQWVTSGSIQWFSSAENLVIEIYMGYPPYKTPVSGTLYFEAVLPDGSRETLLYYNPSNQNASFSVNISNITWPSLEGYTPDEEYLSSLPETVYMVNSTTRTISIPYFKVGRVAYISYYNASGTEVMNTETRFLPVQAGRMEFTTWRGYDVYPKSIPYEYGNEDITAKVYLVNIAGISDSAYQEGYRDGEDAGKQDDEYWGDRIQSAESEAYDEGYQKGYDKGIEQNALLQEQISNIKGDYNAVTGFFDGMWQSCIHFAEYVGNGIDISGITLKSVVITVVVIALVATVLVFVLKK